MFELFLYNTIPKSFFLYFSTDNTTYKYFLNIKNFLQTIYFLWGFSESQAKLFSDLLIVDYPIFNLRFLSIYNIVSLLYNFRIILKIFLDLNLTINSITSCYPCAS